MFSQLLLDCMGMWNSVSKDFKINALWVRSGELLNLHYSFLSACCWLSQCFSNQVLLFMV